MSGFINNPSAVVPWVRGELVKALGAEPQNQLGNFVAVTESQQRFEDFAVVGAAPMLREYAGDIQSEGLTDASLRVTPATFRTQLIIKKEDFEDDQIGSIQQRINEVASGAWRQRRAEIYRALTTNANWVDGTAFFADARPARGRGAAYDNNLAGSGTTAANVITDLTAAITALRSFQDEQGQPFNEDLSQIGIIVPPALEFPTRTAIQQGQTAGTNNVFAGQQITMVADGRLTDPNDWYVMNLSGPQKPILFVDRVGLEMEAEQKNFIWTFSFRARNRATMVHPQLAVRVVNT